MQRIQAATSCIQSCDLYTWQDVFETYTESQGLSFKVPAHTSMLHKTFSVASFQQLQKLAKVISSEICVNAK